jgi:hypothetical protein
LARLCIIAGLVNASDSQMISGWSLATSAMSHCQNWTGLVCGLSTRNSVTPWSIQTWMTRRISA